MAKKVTVTQNEKDQVPVEIIATSIRNISASMKKIRAGELNERALLVLLQDATSLSQRDIKKVLSALDELEHLFLKKKKA